MNEDKSMIEYKEGKGIFQWLKSKFEKLIEKFRPKVEVKKDIEEGSGFTAEELEAVQGGFPDRSVLDYEELEAKINNLQEPSSWNLTEEEQEIVDEGYEEIRARYSQQEREEQELFEEDLDKITAGHPIIDEDEYIK